MIYKTDHRTILQSIYNDALAEMANGGETSRLPQEVKDNITTIIGRSEANKGLYTVVMTLFAHKIFDPAQDISQHQ